MKLLENGCYLKKKQKKSEWGSEGLTQLNDISSEPN